MVIVYEVVKVLGLGLIESPLEEHFIGLMFLNKDEAVNEADKLWKEQITEKDRNSGWCSLHYVVKTCKVKSLVETTNNDILEKEIRAKVSDEIKSDLKGAMENCTALGRDAYGRYIDNMVNMIINKINKKII